MMETMLIRGTPGVTYELAVRRFGTPGARPKAYVQAGLHADEVPGMLAAYRLCHHLARLQEVGGIAGEVVVLPAANPIALSQRLLGSAIGRFDLADGGNFNRGYPALRPDVPGLGDDPAVNTALVRAALLAAHAEGQPVTPAQHLKHALLGLALDADVVLDLHCDGEAVMHLYTLTPAAEMGRALGGFLGAEAILLAEESGGDPFDEACSRPWLALHRQNPAVPLACFAATVELRGQADVSDALAEADALALLDFLRWRGVLSGPAPTPLPCCEPTPMAGAEPLEAPMVGVVVYRREVGEQIGAGDVVADIVDPATGEVAEVRAQSAGLLFARGVVRFAPAGRRLGKIAGRDLAREGKLLSP